MEVEQSSNVIAKRVWKIVKIVLYMLKKSITKSKLLVDLQMMMKRGKLAGKAISNLMIYNHYAAFTCRSNNDLSFISPQEYEFSCSNTPFYASYFTKRKSHHHQNSIDDINLARKVFEMLNNHEKPEASPLALPGFGQTPMVRQLRITDSPFPIKEEDDPRVDKAAEDFIKKFYKELKQQKGTPSPYNIWSR
ncbi:hypothetical protein DCAR_0205253 [Daucus carota subsp. sativus]|uniref:Uncharacterized protein n=1 Tax=Daucus carota subsp. sativus TaxID=79200 RepID=A0A175YBH1_DAUCS|nr:PREDICTED: uncharacterized protein LOC108192662 [Daucus carota subsp. sativus]WOG86055.1 hypothetical protein DCAR_0205253 [Daucus carota subsp. sativus]